MTMRIDLILPQFVLLDVMYVLAACMQTIHVPLVVSRRMSYNRVAACLYEASLVVHLAIVAIFSYARRAIVCWHRRLPSRML